MSLVVQVFTLPNEFSKIVFRPICVVPTTTHKSCIQQIQDDLGINSSKTVISLTHLLSNQNKPPSRTKIERYEKDKETG
jgi:hypothetical protein